MKLLQEPLLHFLLIGAALFAAYSWLNPGEGARHRIVVTQAQVDAIAAQFKGTWQRAPSPDELRGLVDSWARDEMLYREGEALGLAREDPVVKRRVRQKFEVISEESAARPAPSDADLAAYLEANGAAFRRPGHVSFEQVLVAPVGADTDTQQTVAAARAALAAGAPAARVGRSTMLPDGGENVPIDLVARDFGAQFASQLDALPLGEWAGPVTSGFGLHLVRVSARVPGGVPPLADIRAAVTREWESARRREALDAQLRKLRERYEVVVDADLGAVTAAQVVAQ
ncbi:MAG: peptidyl-prolyl cis-trans isomerase [Betaproteobacteria bacterium]